MIFSSNEFLGFFLPIVLFAYYGITYLFHKPSDALPHRRRLAGNCFLLLASLIFYAYGEPWFVLVMIASIIFNWFFGLLIDRFRANTHACHIILVVTALFNLSIIFVFKYLMFTLNTINRVFQTNILVPKIILPIGISFFTFQALSYVADIYRGHGTAQKNPLNVGLYISFFPQLIAGPIVRYETVAEQINNRRESFEKFSQGVCRFIIGLAKKMILANSMGQLADAAFKTPAAELSAGFAWLGILAYAFQIFFDFSGYSDMAIGLGKMFGFDFLENFNFPYISASITEFWRRWHISLGTWFRDYVYIPLGGSRVKSRLRLVFNLFAVWFLTGLWHGASWTFIFWGLMYFALLVFEKLTGLAKTERFKAARHVYTLFFVLMGWVLFRSGSMTQSLNYYMAMFGLSDAGIWDSLAYFNLCEYFSTFVICIAASLPLVSILKTRCASLYNKVCVLKPVFYTMLLIISISYIAKSSYNPFIYFNF